MKLKLIAILAVFISLAAINGQAMEMEKGGMGMDMHGNYIMLPNCTEGGVTAMAHLKDIKAAMAKLGRSATNHFMVMFTDQKSGARISEGLVALKIIDPQGKVTGPIQLMPMAGAFGGDITLPEQGSYRLEVGTRLKDGAKRKFRFTYTVK